MLLYTTSNFKDWISSLDRSVQIRIDLRLQHLADGNPGLHKRFDRLLELKWSSGQMGLFRVYCMEKDGILLLIGGDKSSQSKDITLAKNIMKGVIDGVVRTEIYE